MEAPATEWLTIRQFASSYQVNERTVRRWIKSETSPLRIRRIGATGRTIRIHSSELHSESNLPAAA